MTDVKYLNENVSGLSKKAQKSAVLKGFCTQHGSGLMWGKKTQEGQAEKLTEPRGQSLQGRR